MGSKIGLIVLLLAVAVFGYGLYRTWGSSGDPGSGASASGDPSADAPPAKEQPPAKTPDDDDPKPRVRMQTTHGVIVVELNREKAPITVENFLHYVADGHYDGTIFHRVVEKFAVQGGHFTEDDQKTTHRAAIKNEASNGLSNELGTIAMARTEDADSATDQFYFNVAHNDSLDPVPGDRPGYTVFGRIIEGLEVVVQISRTPTINQGGAFTSIPRKSVILQSAKRE